MKTIAAANQSSQHALDDWNDDDEPNYDSLSDEVLDQLYYADAADRKKLLKRIYAEKKGNRGSRRETFLRARRPKSTNSTNNGLRLNDWDEGYEDLYED